MLDIAVPPHGLQMPLFGSSVTRRLRALGDRGPGLALVEVSVVEQRYRAVLQARSGVPVTEVAERFGVSRQSVHAWLRRYQDQGMEGLLDRSHRPVRMPEQIAPEV